MTRLLCVLTLVTSVSWGAAAQAAPWEVTPAEEGCATTVRLAGAAGAGADLRLISTGDATRLSLVSPPLEAEADGRAFLPVVVDGKRHPLLFERRGDRLTATVPPALEQAIARGARLGLPWRGRVSASLVGSRVALEDLRSCARQVRQAEAAKAQAQARQAEAEAVQARALAAGSRLQAMDVAQRRYREDMLLSLGANLVGAGAPAGATSRTYRFPGAEPITCTGGLEAAVCR